MQKAVFIDRDGVINETYFKDGKTRAPDHLHQFKFFSGVIEAIELIKSAGFLAIVVTNQPDVARGWQKRDVVDSMNQKVKDELGVHEIKVCFHTDEHHCECRKPKPGMLLEAAQEWDVDLSVSFMVGDRHSDIEAGNAAGCTSILVGPGDLNVKKSDFKAQFESLLEAANWIIQNER